MEIQFPKRFGRIKGKDITSWLVQMDVNEVIETWNKSSLGYLQSEHEETENINVTNETNNTLHQILRNLTLELRKGIKLQFGMMVTGSLQECRNK